MNCPYLLIISILTITLSACGGGSSNSITQPQILSKKQLGEKLFSDVNLSLNRTQSCATCHNPNHAFIDPRVNAVKKAVSTGQDGISFGDRNTPTLTYAKLTPTFKHQNGIFTGGQFLDGRELDLKAQAAVPILNPVEMAMPDKATVVARLQDNDDYSASFKALFGEAIFENIEKAYAAMTESIAAFETTEQFATFDSKYDRSLRSYQGADKYTLTVQERLGKALFFSETKTNCNACHQLKTVEGAAQETFTNYQYHNLGVPKNTIARNANGKGSDFVDKGLLDNPAVNAQTESGKFKIATLRNIAVSAPYMHNGVFQELRTVILFYDKFNNTERINNPETGLPWRDPELNQNLALESEEFKAPRLKDEEVDALIAFLKLLTDKRYEHFVLNER
jgi:cytochrome c peroxidase